MKEWEKEGQPEFDFADCYITNYPPLDLSAYEGDRNYHFYELQNTLLLTYNKTHKIDKNILWQMFETIEGVVGSLAKKHICTGCVILFCLCEKFVGALLESGLLSSPHARRSSRVL